MVLRDFLVDPMVDNNVFSSLYESIQNCRSGFEVSRALQIEGGNGERRCFADT